MMRQNPPYRGRFAPTPSGFLHFGSLVAALGSFLDARAHGGTWLVRIEDLDPPRCQQGAAEHIIQTLQAHGMQSDEPILWQSTRTAAYRQALAQLQQQNVCYGCHCTRKQIIKRCPSGVFGAIYDGHCRDLNLPATRAIRVKVAGEIDFIDAIMAAQHENLPRECGDFHLRRGDGLFAYHLALVVDDAHQNITHVVRGADLIASTARQIYLQKMLKLPTPQYAHLPLVCDHAGDKFSKHTHAPAILANNACANLRAALRFLNQPVTRGNDVGAILRQATAQWDIGSIPKVMGLPFNQSETQAPRWQD